MISAGVFAWPTVCVWPAPLPIGSGWALGKWAIGLGVVALALGIWGAVIVNNATNKLNHDLNLVESSINNVPSIPPTTP